MYRKIYISLKSGYRMTNKDYAIMLLDAINDDLFGRLNRMPSDSVKAELSQSYDSLRSRYVTSASSPVKAIGNIFFQKFGDSITPKSLLKMLKPDVELFAFEIPEFDNRGGSLDKSEADILRICELASNIAEQRGRTYEDYYNDARALMDIYNSNRKSILKNK